ncbi:MAG: ParA family protein [Acidobacteriota bacterium]
MRRIAVCNLKGGVGKTTTTVNLGACLARSGKRVLLIDCDPQGSLTHWMRAEPDCGGASLYEILRGQGTVSAVARPTRWSNLWVVPSSPKLIDIDRGALAGERVLWARMSSDYDFALFDCSASPGVVLTNALTAADWVIAPVQAKGLALGGLARLLEVVDEVRERGNRQLALAGIVICLYDARTRISRLVLGQLRARYDELVFDTLVHENVRLTEAADRRLPITDYDPLCRGAAEYSALAFEVLARERRTASLQAPTSLAARFGPLSVAARGSRAQVTAVQRAEAPRAVAGV